MPIQTCLGQICGIARWNVQTRTAFLSYACPDIFHCRLSWPRVWLRFWWREVQTSRAPLIFSQTNGIPQHLCVIEAGCSTIRAHVWLPTSFHLRSHCSFPNETVWTLGAQYVHLIVILDTVTQPHWHRVGDGWCKLVQCPSAGPGKNPRSLKALSEMAAGERWPWGWRRVEYTFHAVVKFKKFEAISLIQTKISTFHRLDPNPDMKSVILSIFCPDINFRNWPKRDLTYFHIIRGPGRPHAKAYTSHDLAWQMVKSLTLLIDTFQSHFPSTENAE